MGLFLVLFLLIPISLASEGPVLNEKPKTAVGRAKGDNLLNPNSPTYTASI